MNCIKSLALTAALLLPGAPVWGGPAFFDDFENGLGHWQPRSEGDGVIVEEPGAGNHVLELTPREDSFSHILLRPELPHGNLRMEGRFKFPTQGDGYLGLIYNHRPGTGRTDFGVLYIKSNGSYVRVSPHYDGNPSWRLYPELETPLSGPRQLETGVWYAFRLDVQGRYAALFIDDFSEPVVEFNAAPNNSGTLGLEARPGFGEPVWVDDVSVSGHESRSVPPSEKPPESRISGWQFQPAAAASAEQTMALPDLPESSWNNFAPDSRGALVTGKLTQYVSGQNSVVHLKAEFESGENERSGWLAISSANQLDVWLDGEYIGSVAPQPFIWKDHVANPEHFGARLPLHIEPGAHELLFRVQGRRFAGGGFFSELVFAGESVGLIPSGD